jgi:4-carboxymuconolactone decarboxylase
MGASRRAQSPARDRAAAGYGALIGFAAAMTRGRRAPAARALERARRAGTPRRAAEETALMLVLHAGFPAALEALATLADAWPGRAAAGAERSRARWRADGMRRCRRVYGATISRLLENVRRLHPAMAAWMVEEGYGRVLSRPGLDAATRELVAVAVLAAGGWERQLLSHLLGAARMGCTPGRIRAAFLAGTREAEPEGRRAGARAWRRFANGGGARALPDDA